MKRLQYLHNIYFALLIRLGISLLLFFLTRVLFLAFNYEYFSFNSTYDFFRIFFFGLKFDLSVVMLINAFYIFLQTLPFAFRASKIYQGFAEGIFYLTHIIALLPNCVDLVFFRFIFKRSTFDVAQSVFIGDELETLFFQYIRDYWYVVVIWLALIAVMILLYRISSKKIILKKWTFPRFLIQTVVMIFILGIAFVISRGGFQLRPISILTASEVASARNTPLVINSTFSLIITMNSSELPEKNYMSSGQASTLFNPVKKYPSATSAKKMNMIIIVLESFSKEYSGLLNSNVEGYKGYTPFLDSLMNSGLCFVNAYANARRSIEGIPAIISGLPSLMNDAFITSSYAGNDFNSLPILLKSKGYSSAFFHGGNNGTMNFDIYALAAGYEKYYGRNEYNNDLDYDGKWGIYDEEFLQYSAQTLNSQPEPFTAVIYTLSSHHPYKIPERYKKTFEHGNLEIHQSIQYADYALRQFFKTASAMPWFKNTLFVVTADHSSVCSFPYYQSIAGAYAIPVIYYLPDGSLNGFSDIITQQADILPSVLHLLNYNEPFVSFGSSVFDSAAPHFAVFYSDNTYYLIKDQHLLQFDGNTSGGYFNLCNDSLLQNNLLNAKGLKFKQAEIFLKAYIQQYNNRIIKNKLRAVENG